MSWTTDDHLNSLDLADVATFAKVIDEVPSPFSDAGVGIPGRDGVQFDPAAPFAPLVATLHIVLRWTNSSGTVTHVDGEVGHIRENLSLIKRELSKTTCVWSRTLEHIGAVRAVVKSNTAGVMGEQRHIFNFPLTIAAGSWQDATESSNTAPVTLGDRRIFDPRISLPSAGTYTITDADGTVYTITATAGPTYPVVVDVGASTVLDNGGADASGDVSFSHQEMFRLSPNHTHVTTGGGTIFWRNRWA
jgi:hypothetical protein